MIFSISSASSLSAPAAMILLIRNLLAIGMSLISASALMITGPATKITNLGALKIVRGMKRFLLYLAFVMAFSLVTGLLVNIII